MVKDFILILLISFTILSSSEQNPEKLEGKWRVSNWTYFILNGNGPKAEAISNLLSDLTLDFKTDGTISTNKPNEFIFREDSQYKLDGIFLKFDNFTSEIFKKNNKHFLKIDGIILEIEKIKNYSGSKLIIKKVASINHNLEEVMPIENIDKAILIIDSEKKVYPKIKGLNTIDCGYYCVKNSFTSKIIESIDVSKVTSDKTYLIEVIVNKKGKICNIKVNSIDDYYSIRFPELEPLTDNKKELSIIDKTIIQSVLKFQGQLLPAENSNGKINSKLRFVISVVSNH